MRLRTLTKGLLIAGPVCVGLYELAAFLACGSDATISRVVLGWNDSCAMLGFAAAYAAGLLTGHFWFPQHPAADSNLAKGG